MDGCHVGQGGQVGQTVAVAIDDGNVIGFVTQHFRKVGTDLACAYDDDFHTALAL